ncbi:DUF4865 family protein [Bacillus zhangzhouensis]|uniref:DUF4865 family protein n=1 Tax=Bacillus zhangzhouensis TaxID=1178540 RepID=UPI002813604C|nr:DUF4865 family protein [Bacillus zhangzhouensis]MDR0127022.1 DUF4865 family protein [Bacillus zhangzhouensis]
MHAMQYHVDLPADYDMGIIRRRVLDNGWKTDGLKGLLFKAYLITEKNKYRSLNNSYCPLYIWTQSEDMTDFIFKGSFDQVLRSFGWKQIRIAITYSVHLTNDFERSKYVLEEYVNIHPTDCLEKLEINHCFSHVKGNKGEVIIYNPDKWKFVKYTFLHSVPEHIENHIRIYEIAHLSLDHSCL